MPERFFNSSRRRRLFAILLWALAAAVYPLWRPLAYVLLAAGGAVGLCDLLLLLLRGE
jgi:hypothetical protein